MKNKELDRAVELCIKLKPYLEPDKAKLKQLYALQKVLLKTSKGPKEPRE